MGQRFSQSTVPLPDSRLIRFFREFGEPLVLPAERGFLPRGENPAACYVERGWMNRVHHGEMGEPAITATYIPGDFINLDTMCEKEPLGRISALTDSSVLTVPVADLRRKIGQDAAMLDDVLQRMVAEADWLREALMAMGRLGSRDRILYYFGQMRRRQIAFGTLERETRRYELPITQRHLATMVGISAIHANRLARELEAAELLTLRNKSIFIHDIAKFEKAFETLTLSI